jgi:hypothetical protein
MGHRGNETEKKKQINKRRITGRNKAVRRK